MPPDIDTLRLLLVLAREYRSDDRTRRIVPMGEEDEEYWGASLAGICNPCSNVRYYAISVNQPPDGLTMPEVHAIGWWRPVRDAEDAWAFLAHHVDCAQRPRLDIGIDWD